MEQAEITDKVRSVLAEQLGVGAERVTSDARLAEDLDADSLDLTEAVMALEDEFGIEIPESDLQSVHTVGEAIDLVAAKLGVAA
jgi:acyl carrier protein